MPCQCFKDVLQRAYSSTQWIAKRGNHHPDSESDAGSIYSEDSVTSTIASRNRLSRTPSHPIPVPRVAGNPYLEMKPSTKYVNRKHLAAFVKAHEKPRHSSSFHNEPVRYIQNRSQISHEAQYYYLSARMEHLQPCRMSEYSKPMSFRSPTPDFGSNKY